MMVVENMFKKESEWKAKQLKIGVCGSEYEYTRTEARKQDVNSFHKTNFNKNVFEGIYLHL
jgi:hypothetical protein